MIWQHWFVSALWLGLIGLPLPARAALVCDADIASLNFGLISVRDGVILHTSSPVKVSCAGGIAGTSVFACLTIGSGNGGTSLTPRYMTGGDAAPLAYQLTRQNIRAAGGTTWDVATFTVPLDDASASGAVNTTLYAEVTAIGAQVTVGAYHARFEAGTDVTLSYGETGCDTSGAVGAFRVEAVVTPSCTVTVSDMDFGVINAPIIAPVDQIATISVTCTHLSPYTIGLDHGRNAVDAGQTGRRMANGGDLLAYGLYRDPARTAAWGLVAQTVATGTGTGGNQALTIYGRIFAHQQTVVGTYIDTAVVVVSY